MSTMKLRNITRIVTQIAAILAILVGSAVWVGTSKATPRLTVAARPEAVIDWNAITLRAVITVGGQSPPASFVYGAYVQAAVYNAVVAIEGGYEPYRSNIVPTPGASVDAAVATAAHGVLINYFPLQQSALDADYLACMAAITDGRKKLQGSR